MKKMTDEIITLLNAIGYQKSEDIEVKSETKDSAFVVKTDSRE
jgi:hypothetical protein